jgi:hypothetical protein
MVSMLNSRTVLLLGATDGPLRASKIKRNGQSGHYQFTLPDGPTLWAKVGPPLRKHAK